MTKTGILRSINIFSAFVIILACLMWGPTFQKLSPGYMSQVEWVRQLGESNHAVHIVNSVTASLLQNSSTGSEGDTSSQGSSRTELSLIQLLIFMMNAAFVCFESFLISVIFGELIATRGYSAGLLCPTVRYPHQYSKYYSEWTSGFLCPLQKTIITLVRRMDSIPVLISGRLKPVLTEPAQSALILEVRVFFMSTVRTAAPMCCSFERVTL